VLDNFRDLPYFALVNHEALSGLRVFLAKRSPKDDAAYSFTGGTDMNLGRRAIIAALLVLVACMGLALAQQNRTQNNRARTVNCEPPVLRLAAPTRVVMLGCDGGQTLGTPTASQIQLNALADDPQNNSLRYQYSTVGGRIVGDGASVMWDLAGVQPGTYTATVEVDNNCGCTAFASTSVIVRKLECAPPCPTVSVDVAATSPDEGTPVTFTANLAGGAPNLRPAYNWSLTGGSIISGQGTPAITVDTRGLGGQTITASLDLAGLPPSCRGNASASVSPLAPRKPTQFDEYPDINFNNEKARLDNFAIQLQQDPGSVGYLVAYGARAGQAQERLTRAMEYLVNSRGIDAGRVKTIEGGCRSEFMMQLVVAPTGTVPPVADASGTVPCGAARPQPAPRPHRRGRR